MHSLAVQFWKGYTVAHSHLLHTLAIAHHWSVVVMHDQVAIHVPVEISETKKLLPLSLLPLQNPEVCIS